MAMGVLPDTGFYMDDFPPENIKKSIDYLGMYAIIIMYDYAPANP